MRTRNGFTLFTGVVLLLGAVLVPLGMGIRPLLVEQNFHFQPADFDSIRSARGIWILSYQILVFGLFMRLAGLVALGSLHGETSARTVLYPGIAICAAGLVINSLSAGYYMHTGFWGADTLAQATPEMRGNFLTQIQPTSEYMICLERMGKMFFSLGLVFTGAGLYLAALMPRWLGMAAVLIGLAGMAALFIAPFSQVVFIPFDVLIALWFATLGGMLAWRPAHTAQPA
jgi:hypothetical protein